MRFSHISPTYYSADSVVGGGERYPIYLIRAIERGSALLGLETSNILVAFGKQPGAYPVSGNLICDVLPGDPMSLLTIPSIVLRNQLQQVDVVVVHQCLTPFGLFAAGQAKMLGKTVIGFDHGGGEHPLVRFSPEPWGLFDLLVAYSEFGAETFRGATVPSMTIPGPVDTFYYKPNLEIGRDPALVLAVGRILPHKGLERTITSLNHGQRLVLAGSTSDKAYSRFLMRLVHRSGHQVEIVTGLSDDEVRHLMCEASVLVQASTHVDYRGGYYAKPELLGLAPLEALSCGTPALVSTAGALPELAAIQGCRTFGSDTELAEQLDQIAAGRFVPPRASAIHQDVEARYGLDAYGQTFLRAVLSVGGAT
ncbi:MAG TPA: glycosyltransferase family 4 protein [Candidatus Dormibacteraeota bacterium]|nr:glycosyltransferase family 4 protein [Candidatus Dormibacteraeota bacterium]